MQHVRPLSDDGRSISRDVDGFPVTCRYSLYFLILKRKKKLHGLLNNIMCLSCSGRLHDSMVVLKQESRFAKANDSSFLHVRFLCINVLC